MPKKKTVEEDGVRFRITWITKEEVLKTFAEVGNKKETAEALDSGYNCAKFEDPWDKCVENGWIRFEDNQWTVTKKGKKKLTEI